MTGWVLTPESWPFADVIDDSKQPTGWIALQAPVTSPGYAATFAAHRRRGARFVGMTSFLDWPGPSHRDFLHSAGDPADDDLDYSSVCEAWCHCFRDPSSVIPADTPQTMLALSDFVDAAAISPDCLNRDIPRFDVVLVAAAEPWKQRVKAWDLAVDCLSQLAAAGFTCLVIGAPGMATPWHAGVTAWPWLSRRHFHQVLAASRSLLVTSETDPSPRVLAEALCLDVPIVVNRRILGGWHYVTDHTGRFFGDADQVVGVVTDLIGTVTRPRSWWLGHSGPERAGRRLCELLASIDPSIAARAPLMLSLGNAWATGRE